MTIKPENKSPNFFLSFKYAFQGIKTLFKENRNARIELIIAIMVISGAIIFHITSVEWLIILLLIGGVFAAEGFNSAIEVLANKLHPSHDSKIGKVKDMAAGAVLLVSFVAAIAGFIIFAPYFIKLFMK